MREHVNLKLKDLLEARNPGFERRLTEILDKVRDQCREDPMYLEQLLDTLSTSLAHKSFTWLNGVGHNDHEVYQGASFYFARFNTIDDHHVLLHGYHVPPPLDAEHFVSRFVDVSPAWIQMHRANKERYVVIVIADARGSRVSSSGWNWFVNDREETWK